MRPCFVAAYSCLVRRGSTTTFLTIVRSRRFLDRPTTDLALQCSLLTLSVLDLSFSPTSTRLRAPAWCVILTQKMGGAELAPLRRNRCSLSSLSRSRMRTGPTTSATSGPSCPACFRRKKLTRDTRFYPNYLVFFNAAVSARPLASSQYAGRKSSAVPAIEKYLLGGEGEMLTR